jgi:hypothetical protein
MISSADQLRAAIQRDKTALAAKVTDLSADQLTREVHSIARLEGQLVAYATYEEVFADNFENYPDDPMHAAYRNLQAITRLLMRGADDDFSGRGNDTRRARHDGLRTAVDEIYYDIIRSAT